MEHRYEILKAMHTIMCAMNNEEAYFNHWVYLVPDAATDEDLREIAADESFFADVVACFRRNFPRYADDGLFVGGKVY